MARLRYTGNAQRYTQEDVRTVTTPATGDDLTVVVNGKTFSYELDSGNASDEETAFAEAYNEQENIGELRDATAEADGADVHFVSNNPGQPFTFTYAGTGTTTFPAGTGSVSNGGPEVVSTTANWSGTPSAADDLTFDKPQQDVLYDLAGLAATAFTSVTVMASFDGALGLPVQNETDYPEYRATHFSCNSPLVVVGAGEGPGPRRCNMNLISGSNTTVEVYRTAGSADDYPAANFYGSATVTVCRVSGGEVGLAAVTGQTLTVTTLTVGGAAAQPYIRGGIGLTLANLTASGGTVELWSMPTTLCKLIEGATVRASGGGNCTTVTVDDGTLRLGGVGTAITLTNLEVGEAGVLDLSEGTGSVTVTNPIVLRPGFSIDDPLNRLAVGNVFSPESCRLDEGTYRSGPGRTLSIAS
jgi:hypothetical protein